MSKRQIISWLCLAVCVSLMASSCAAPPTDAMNAAEEAIQNAKEEEVDKYAPTEFEKAQAELAKAQKHMAAEEYREARTAAEKTIALARTAAKETTVQKTIIQTQSLNKMNDFREMWGALSKKIEKGRTRQAKALAKEAGEFATMIADTINVLKSSQKWVELNMVLEEANKKVGEFQEKLVTKK